MPRCRISPNILNQPIKCCFDLLGICNGSFNSACVFSSRKRVFWDGQSFTPGHFRPQSCHLVRLTRKIGEMRFSTKIQTEILFFGKTNSRRLLRQNWAKFSSGTTLPPNAPYSQLGPEKRYETGFIKKFQSKTCFLGWTKLHSGTLSPPIVPSSPFNQENRWGAI